MFIIYLQINLPKSIDKSGKVWYNKYIKEREVNTMTLVAIQVVSACILCGLVLAYLFMCFATDGER